MRIILIILFQAILTLSSLYGQKSGWNVQNPFPPAWSYSDVFFINQSEGWASSAIFDGIVHTKDGGLNWEVQLEDSTGPQQGITAIHFIDRKIGWAVGGNPFSLFTPDGGENWIKIYDERFTTMLDIFFINENVGWMVGYGGILYTNDSGESWITQDLMYIPRSVHFISPDTGWVVGNSGLIARTTDGGENWITISIGEYSHLYSVYFIDQYKGWAVGSGGQIVYSVDGGDTWIPQDGITSEYLKSVYFVDEYEGWIVGDHGTILHTKDGGINWIIQDSKGSLRLESIHFPTVNYGWAVGLNGTILHTIDGGDNWLKQVEVTDKWMNGIFFLDENIGWAVGYSGTFLKTTNGGTNWILKDKPTEYNLTSIYFLDENIGWAVGWGKTILSTTDGGTTWIQYPTTNLNRLQKIIFIDENIGWIVGYGTVLYTLDGGSNWTESTNLPIYGQWDNCFFLNSSTCWITGSPNGGDVIMTTDGGQNWFIPDYPTSEYLTSVFFIDENSGWILGYPLFKTRDGGVTWEDKTGSLPPYGRLNKVFFSDTLTGWVLTNSTIYHTSDGGDTWNDQLLHSQYRFTDFFWLNENFAWAVGWWGTILHTKFGGNFDTKIFGYAKYGDSEIPIENRGIYLYARSPNSEWVIYDQVTTDENGYYEFTSLDTKQYRIYPSTHPDFWFASTFDEQGEYSGNIINVKDNYTYRRDFRFTRRINISSPKTQLVYQLPFNLEWESVPLADKYRVEVITFFSPWETLVNTLTSDTTFYLQDISSFGPMRLRITALDNNGYRIGSNEVQQFYITNTIVKNDISNNTIWSGGILVKNDITIKHDATLTILPGTVVFFDSLDGEGNRNKFSINVEGSLLALGEKNNRISFLSYIVPYGKHKWEQIYFNSNNKSVITNTTFSQASIALNIINSNVELTSNSFYATKTAIVFDGNYVNTQVNDCYLSSSLYSDGFLKIKNGANPVFTNCNMWHPNENLNYLIELENTANNISIINSWVANPEILESLIYDKHDDPSLGEVVFEQVINDPNNLSPGAENVELNNNVSDGFLIKNTNKSEYDPYKHMENVLGYTDGKEYFLNGGYSIILDMGFNGDIIDGILSDIMIQSMHYSNNHNINNFVNIYLSNNKNNSWELLGSLGGNNSLDISTLSNDKYRYVKIKNISPVVSSSDSVGVFIDAIISLNDTAFVTNIGVNNIDVINNTFYLSQNFPNPFNPVTNIRFSLPENIETELSVYNVLGEKIKTLVRRHLQAGCYVYKFDGSALSSGMYFYVLRTSGKITKVKKMLLIK